MGIIVVGQLGGNGGTTSPIGAHAGKKAQKKAHILVNFKYLEDAAEGKDLAGDHRVRDPAVRERLDEAVVGLHEAQLDAKVCEGMRTARVRLDVPSGCTCREPIPSWSWV